MEESDLLRERLQAITEKHRIQEDIRRKKEELDREKLKLQHLKKKSLREQWLLQGAVTHNATHSPQRQLQQESVTRDQQETKTLQLNIHRIEMDILSLEREESIISTNEGFILNRLKAVERSSEDIIKEAQDSFCPLRSPQWSLKSQNAPPPPASQHHEPITSRETLFAMEINVSKNLLTGESKVLSTATIPADELHQHTGLKVYDDGRKCVYALNSQERSHDRSCASELSANEVEQLLRSATVHRKENHQKHCKPHSTRKELYFYNRLNEIDGGGDCDIINMGGNNGDHLLRKSQMETDYRWQRKASADNRENHYRGQEKKKKQSNLREGHRHENRSGFGHYYGNQKCRDYSSYEGRNCHTVQGDQPHCCYTSCITRSNSRIHGDRANGCAPPRSHDQEAVSAHQPQLCYTPANHIPLSDYISVDEEDLYCLSQPSDHNGNHYTALYSGPASSDRLPSPLFEDNAPYTILNAVNTTEPITAIFMGFQTAQDDRGLGHEFEGSLKAELVIIEDNEDDGEDNNIKENNNACPTADDNYLKERSTNGNTRHIQRPVGPGIRKIQKKHCCTVC
ncbi:palmdelphin-like [Tautogolabrus adspersus]